MAASTSAREALRNISGIDPGPTTLLVHKQMLQDVRRCSNREHQGT
jgi:hypothetical protein